MSFLALRYLIQTGILFPCIPVNLEFCLDALCTCIRNVIRLVDSYNEVDAALVEWELLDSWVWQVLGNMHTGVLKYANSPSWNRALLGILRYDYRHILPDNRP